MRGEAGGPGPEIVPLLTEMGDLKRITWADADTSFATRMFLRGWGRIMAGGDREEIAYEQMAGAVAAARLGALDGDKLSTLGLGDEEARDVLLGSLREVADPLDPALAERLREAVPVHVTPTETDAPSFAFALSRQPRAGVTCPGRARVMLRPEENHADHCLMVAVYAGLLAPAYGADPARAWWFGMVHHFHNAAMPDAGFTGEMLLEPHLARVIGEARRQVLAELPETVREAADVFGEIDGHDTPEARAFHAADVIDRVLEIQHHTRANALTMDRVLSEYELVHEGPVKDFHDSVIEAVHLP